MEQEQTTIHRRQPRKPRFLWTVDLNLRSLRYLLFKIFRRRFCYRENTVLHRFAPAHRSMRRLGVSWAEKEKTQSRNAESAINHLSSRSCAKADWWLRRYAAVKRTTFFLPLMASAPFAAGKKVSSTYFLAHAIRSRLQLRSSLRLIFSRWLSIVFTLR